MANINVKLKNAAGDILYPQTEWSNIQNKPSLHLTEFMNISGYTLDDDEEFCLYWIGSPNNIKNDIDKISFIQILSLCVRNLHVASPYYNQLRITQIRKTTGSLQLRFVDDSSTSTSEKSVELTSSNILQDDVFDLVN